MYEKDVDGLYDMEELRTNTPDNSNLREKAKADVEADAQVIEEESEKFDLKGATTMRVTSQDVHV